MGLWNSGGKECETHAKHFYTHSDMPRIKRVPGVFVVEKVAFTSLGFPPSVVCFNGVLEVTLGDMRAGVFTMDLLYSLS